MSEEFAPGDEIICIDDNVHLEWPENSGCTQIPLLLVRGSHYIVREILLWEKPSGEHPAIRLQGITRGQKDTPLLMRRFRKVKAQNIAIFKKMCETAPLYAKKVKAK